jgi:hypothetical protein
MALAGHQAKNRKHQLKMNSLGTGFGLLLSLEIRIAPDIPLLTNYLTSFGKGYAK